MKKRLLISLLSVAAISASAQLNNETAAPRATITNGTLEGTYASGIRIFKGVPYAKPPVGDLRWKEPQPAANWTGIRKGRYIRATGYAVAPVRRYDFPLQWHERRLPISQRVDTGKNRC